MKLFILLLFLTPFPASAELFKCKDSNGKVSYQEQPSIARAPHRQCMYWLTLRPRALRMPRHWTRS
jgi:Domain of unknown function (DUF4124)